MLRLSRAGVKKILKKSSNLDKANLTCVGVHCVGGQCRKFQIGVPLLSRRTSVAVPFTISRARIISAASCLTFDPVRAISSPILELIHLTYRKNFGQRY